MSPFRNIFWFTLGEFLAKALNFILFVYLARVLGVEKFGVLEFSLSIIIYFLWIADFGLELYGTRELARGNEPTEIVGRVLLFRIPFAILGFLTLLAITPFLPDYPNLKLILTLYGTLILIQSVNFKWVFLGLERMKLVGGAILVGQIIITVLAFTIVQAPDDVYWVPVTRIVGEIALAGIFLGMYFSGFGKIRFNFPLTRVRDMLKPSSILGLSTGLALMSFNFDTVLLGFLSGPQQVGWYSAAYKPVTAGLLIPVTYFLGLFPSISRMFTNDKDEFIETVNRSFRLTAIVAIPFAVAGTFLASPIILSLFGSEYSRSILAMQILVWPAALVILRGTLRQSLNAANQHLLDLRSALISIIVNVGLNLALIPAYGMIGSAIAYLVSEILWIGLASFFFYQKVHRETLIPFLKIPVIGGTILAVYFLSTPFMFWPIRGMIGILLYLLALFVFGDLEMRLLFNRIFLRK